MEVGAGRAGDQGVQGGVGGSDAEGGLGGDHERAEAEALSWSGRNPLVVEFEQLLDRFEKQLAR